MANVSKRKLKSEVKKRLDQQLVETVVALRTSSGGAQFLSELFTETEQIIFAKRLMIIFMLTEDISQYRIKQILKVSSSTVSRIADVLDRGEFEYLTRVCRKRKSREVLLQELEVIVRFGMPPQGKDRWKWLDELYKK